MKKEPGWHSDLLEVEYNTFVGVAYSAMFSQVGDIGPSLVPLANEVRLVFLERAYKATIFLWRNILPYHINLSPPPAEEETKAIPHVAHIPIKSTTASKEEESA